MRPTSRNLCGQVRFPDQDFGIAFPFKGLLWNSMLHSPVRFAIVSPGSWGRRLLEAAAQSQLLEFVGVWSRSERNRDEIVSLYGGRAFPEFESLSGDPAVEAVILPTPHFLHFPQTMASLEAGKHVFVEKPIANTVEEAEQMDRAARDRGLVLAVGLQGRRTGGARMARRMIEEGRLGKVVMAVAVQCAPLTAFQAYRDGDWEVDPEKNPGGPLDNLGSHYMDLLQYLLGPPAKEFSPSASRARRWRRIAREKRSSCRRSRIEPRTGSYGGGVNRLANRFENEAICEIALRE